MSKKYKIVFISFFMITILGVGVVQAIYELGKGDQIQMLHFFEDTFIAPIRRANELHTLVDSFSKEVDQYSHLVNKELSWTSFVHDQNNWDESELPYRAENLLFKVKDIKNRIQTVNRYVDLKENNKAIVQIDSLVDRVQSIYDSISERKQLSAITPLLAALREEVRGVARSYPIHNSLSIPILSGKALFSHTFFSAEYLRAYEKEMENSSVVAKISRKWMQFVRYALLDDLGEKAYSGKDGWMFYRQGVDYLVRPYIRDKRSQVVDYNDSKTDDAIRAIVRFRDQLKSMDIELLVVIIPGKASIYPDKLVGSISPRKVGNISQTKRVIKDLQVKGITCIDLFDPFIEARTKKSAAQNALYLKTDTHWRGQAVPLAAKIVAQKIRQYPWFEEGDTEYVIDTVTVDRQGDVGVMTQLPQLEIGLLSVEFPIEQTECYQVWEIKRDEDGNEIGRTVYRDDYSPNTPILLLGDSFSRIYQTDNPRSAGWISHLAGELKQPLSTIVSDGGASTLVRQTLAGKVNEAAKDGRPTLLAGKKLVVWEFVERDLRYGAEGWKDVDLLTVEN